MTSANLTRVFLALNIPLIEFAIYKIIQKWKGINEIISVSDTGRLSQMLPNNNNNYLILQEDFGNLKTVTELKNFISQYNHVNTFIFFHHRLSPAAHLINTLNIKGGLPIYTPVPQIQSMLNVFICKSAQIHSLMQLTPSAYPLTTAEHKITFTPSQSLFLSLYKSGMQTHEIASQLQVTIHSCNKHIGKINKKVRAGGFKNIHQYILSQS